MTTLIRLSCILYIFTFFSGFTSKYKEPPAWKLWPDQEKGSNILQEVVVNRDFDQNTFGLNRSISRVTVPTATVYLPGKTKSPTAAIIICPGGGFSRIVIDKEGHDIARWLNKHGLAGIVLKYRTDSLFNHNALADVQRTIQMIRSKAEELNIRPDQIGVMGFSAGGYLSIKAAIEILPGDKLSKNVIEQESSRPDFFVPIYPAVPPDAIDKITDDNPPAFIACTFDDRSTVSLGSAKLYEALYQAGIPAELHIYAKGGHGYGLGIHGGPIATWPERLADWLKLMGVINK